MRFNVKNQETLSFKKRYKTGYSLPKLIFGDFSITLCKSYNLEYGQAALEIHDELIPPKKRVLIIDDVLATGGTACAAVDLVLMAGLVPVKLAFLLQIPALAGQARIAESHPQIQIHTILAE